MGDFRGHPFRGNQYEVLASQKVVAAPDLDHLARENKISADVKTIFKDRIIPGDETETVKKVREERLAAERALRRATKARRAAGQYIRVPAKVRREREAAGLHANTGLPKGTRG